MTDSDHLLKEHRVTVTGNLKADRTLVFVHGLGSRQEVWQNVIKPFMPDYRIVLLDTIGTASSGSAYRNLEEYADDLADICRTLDLKGSTFIGHSAGAMISVLLATRYPGLVTHLVLIGASPRYLDDLPSGYRGGFSEDDVTAVYKNAVEKFAHWSNEFANAALMAPERPELAGQFVDSLRSLPIQQFMTVLYSIFQSDHRSDLQKVTQPTLLIQSRQDFVVPLEVAHYLQQNIKQSELRIIDVPGHLPHVTRPDIVISELKRFIAH